MKDAASAAVRTGVTLLACGLIALAGCSFDLTKVVADVRGPSLSVRVETVNDSPAALTGSFHPGTTADGVIRVLSDDSIRIDGVPFAPNAHASDGAWIYRIAEIAATAPLIVMAPPVPGLAEPLPALEIEAIRITAPDTLVAARGGVLEIGVTGTTDGACDSAGTRWSIRIQAEDGGPAEFMLNGNVAPPPVLSLPASWLPDELTRGTVHVQAFCGRSIVGPADTYVMTVLRIGTAVVPFRIESP